MVPIPPDKRWREREDREKQPSDTDIEVRRLRYEEWIRERDLVATIVLGGAFRTDGYGRPAGFRVLGYSKSLDKAVEIALRDNLGIRRPNEMFYGELTLNLWSPSGPKK